MWDLPTLKKLNADAAGEHDLYIKARERNIRAIDYLLARTDTALTSIRCIQRELESLRANIRQGT